MQYFFKEILILSIFRSFQFALCFNGLQNEHIHFIALNRIPFEERLHTEILRTRAFLFPVPRKI